MEKSGAIGKMAVREKRAGHAFAEPIQELLPDPQGRFIVAVPRKAAWYWLISAGDKPAAKKIAVAQPLVAACLAGEHLYGVTDKPAKVEKLAVATGKSLKSYDLQGHATQLALGALLETVSIAATGWGMRAEVTRRPGGDVRAPVFEVELVTADDLAQSPLAPCWRNFQGAEK